VGGAVAAPIEISRVEPDCRTLHGAAGSVLVELIVSENGAVEAGRVLRMVSPDAKPAILAAVRQWRFRPATFNGRSVAVYFTVTLRGCP
jgi:periplasmic protein TonB